jgi:two-component system chemotaxis response regulator CheY
LQAKEPFQTETDYLKESPARDVHTRERGLKLNNNAGFSLKDYIVKKILLIDDSMTQLINARITLQRAGYQVEIVADPLQAIDKIKEVSPDLVLTDLNMPNLDGIGVIKAIRQLEQFSRIPVLVMSTDSQKHKFQEARDAGANGWLMKPVKQNALLGVIAKLLTKD